MTLPALFISHSTHSKDCVLRTQELLECLQLLLKERWEVFVDRDSIEPGDSWRAKILHKIDQTQAAIILFDERSIERDWVIAEALMFSFKKSLNPNFQLLPVYMGGISTGDTCFNKYRPFSLQEVMGIEDDGQDIEELASDVVSALKSAPSRLPSSSRWAISMGEAINGLSLETLQQTFQNILDFTGDADVAKCGVKSASCVSQLLHYCECDETLTGVGQLIKSCRSGCSAEAEGRIERISLLFLSKWVSNESVELLRIAARKPGEMNVLGVHAHEPLCFDQIRQRMKHEFAEPMRLIEVDSAICENVTGMFEVVCAAIHGTIFPRGQLPRWPEGNEMSLEEAVNDTLKNGPDLIYCQLPETFAHTDVLTRLSTSFPGIVFLISVPQDHDDADFPIEKLTPKLTVESINSLFRLESSIKAFIEK